MMANRSHDAWWDVGLAGVIAAATAVYLGALPHYLGAPDEATCLYEAKRVLAGQVMYLDFFEIITPGWVYLMALLFRLFGTDIATARIAIAVIHGLTGALTYLACRRCQARRAFSVTAAIAYLAVCQTAWPIASPHWLTTFLCVALLVVCLREPRRPVRWAFTAGVVVGLIIAAYHQRGAAMGLAVAAFLVAEAGVRRRYSPRHHGTGSSRVSLTRLLAALTGGVVVVVAPLCIWMIASAGFGPVWQALIVHPLVHYRGVTSAPWGFRGGFLSSSHASFPLLLKYSPVVLVLTGARLLTLLVSRRDPHSARTLTLLILFCVFSMISIAYFPDFIHIAFVGPAFLVTAAEDLEWIVRSLPGPAMLRTGLAWTAALALSLAGGLHLHWNASRLRGTFTLPEKTAFGRIDMADVKEVSFYRRVEELLQTVPSRVLYCYPFCTYLYLLHDAHNPTRYEFVAPMRGYTSASQVQEIIGTLTAVDVPYIVTNPVLTKPGDPIGLFIYQHYEPVTQELTLERFIYRRKKDGD